MIREIFKTLLLLVLIAVSILIYTTRDTISARALHNKIDKIYNEKGSIHKDLTREERDEYMEYLRSLNGEHVDPVYLIEVP